MDKPQNVFTYKLEIYYQAIAIYGVTLVAYAAVVGFARGSFEHVLRDQVVYVLAACTLAAAAGLIINVVARRRIEIDDEKIVVASSFHRREIPITEIIWVHIGKEKRMKVRGAFRVAKFKLRNRRKLLRLRPSLFHPEDRLVEALRQIDVKVHRSTHGAV